MKLSVVIPTYNRHKRLVRVLDALQAQSCAAADFDIVVVDDGSSDGTAEWLASHAARYRVRAVTLSNGGPARARNAGVAAADGDLLLFIDDDVEPEKELVAEHLASHEGADDWVVIGPLASLAHYAQPWVAWEQRKVEAQYDAMARGDWEPSFRQFWTGNASVARRHVLAAGGFDPTFLRAEDIELGVRMMERGVGFRFNPRARGYHHAERSLASWEHAHSSYGKAEVAILGRLGEPTLLKLLGESWTRLHPGTRWLVRSCIDRPTRFKAVSALLRSHLEVARRTGLPLMSEQVCGVLANLHYWRASVNTLGAERSKRVLGRL